MTHALLRHLGLSIAAATAFCLPSRAEDTINLRASGLLSPEFIKANADTLGIDSTQGENLIAIYAAALKEAAGLEETIKAKRLDLEACLATAHASEADALAKLDALLAAEAPLKRLRLRTLMQLRAGLTPTQQEKARSLAASTSTSPALTPEAEERLTRKAEVLRELVEKEIGTATDGMRRLGDRIKETILAGNVEKGEREIDQMIVLFTSPRPSVDFASHDPGSTSDLRPRYDAVVEKASQVENPALLRQLAVARDALLKAKDAGDAETAGRILSWAEKSLQ